MKLSCPSCGADILFQSKVSLMATCGHCRSLVIRHDMNLDLIGQVAADMDDVSPLQLGTEGTYEDKRFMLVGKLKVRYNAGTWNEWYAIFNDGGEAWLAEAQGFFMLSFRTDADGRRYEGWESHPAEVKRPKTVGNTLTVAKETFTVTDVKHATYVGSEGELPFRAEPNEEAITYDLTGPGGQFASVEYSGKEVRLYVGRYVAFDDFKFSNLRALEGWETF